MSVPSIIAVFSKFDYPREIIQEAIKIHAQMRTSLNRDVNYNLKVLFCLFNAHLNLDRVVDIRVLSYQLNRHLSHKSQITHKKLKSVFDLFSPIETGYFFKKRRFSPKEYLHYYIDLLEDLDYQEKEEVIQIGLLIIDRWKQKTKAQVLAASIVIFYLNLTQKERQRDKFQEILFRRLGTIVSLSRDLNSIYNQIRSEED